MLDVREIPLRCVAAILFHLWLGGHPSPKKLSITAVIYLFWCRVGWSLGTIDPHDPRTLEPEGSPHLIRTEVTFAGNWQLGCLSVGQGQED